MFTVSIIDYNIFNELTVNRSAACAKGSGTFPRVDFPTIVLKQTIAGLFFVCVRMYTHTYTRTRTMSVLI